MTPFSGAFLRACSCLVAVVLGGCREPFLTLAGGPPRGSSARAEQLFAALGARVTEPFRDFKYDSARVKIANAALLPSRVWYDTSVWTATSSARRTLLIGGRFAGGRYRLEAARLVPPPSQLAESRHLINLTRLSDDSYAWDTEVPYAIGTATAGEIGALVAALFASAEKRGDRELRADYRSAAPQTTTILGQLFRVDSVRTTQLQDHSTLASFAVTMDPAGVQGRFPNFADYVRRYVLTARMHWTLTDASGASYLDASAVNGHFLLRVRTLNGDMVPLTGPPRVIPDSLSLNGEFSMKVRRLTVGFHDFHANLTLVRTDHERALSLVSRAEPEWTLPLVAERLLRTPLRRPFEGRGVLFRIGVRDSAGAQTILNRRLHLEVQESTILRFIGKLGAIAIGEYQGKAEREQLAWLREVFAALVADVRTLAP